MARKSSGLMGPSENQERKWRAESALDTLTRAEEIKKDAGLMRDVKKVADTRVKAVESVIGRGRKR
jgi:hypothetical protein